MKQDNAPLKAQSYSHGPRCSIVLFDLVPSCQVSRFQRPQFNIVLQLLGVHCPTDSLARPPPWKIARSIPVIPHHCKWLGTPTPVATRQKQPGCPSTVGRSSFPVTASILWNSLPPDIQSSSPLTNFCHKLKTYMFQQSFPDIFLYLLHIDLVSGWLVVMYTYLY